MITHTFVVLAYKESQYLETCIKSVLNQSYNSNVVIATSTPNQFIFELSERFGLQVLVNPKPGRGIGYDFDFARTCIASDLVTIAHQDDIYDSDYAEKIVKAFNEYKDSTIVFSDYYEVRNDEKVYENKNLKIKRMMLKPLTAHSISNKKFIKRLSLSLGDPICCPAVTFCQKNIQKDEVFSCSFKCSVDWYAWEKISKIPGRFTFVDEPLMGHRIHEESTTTEILENNDRISEDYQMYQCFWPKPIAKVLVKLYSNSEKSNEV